MLGPLNTFPQYVQITVALAWCCVTAARAGDLPEAYVKNCVMCHGKDGKAATVVGRKLGVKDLSKSTLTDAQIEQQIRDGKLDEKKKTNMPAYKDKLTADEIKTLVTTVKEFRK
jgi:mono/diheme cytochrome c family protein